MEVEAELKSKFSNIFIMLLLAIQNNDIDNVKHYLTDELYEKYSKRCEELKKKNQMQLYDEANVKKIEIFDSGILFDLMFSFKDIIVSISSKLLLCWGLFIVGLITILAAEGIFSLFSLIL